MGAARTAAGIALAVSAIAGLGNDARAQSNLARYAVEQELHITYYAADAFTCLSPAALQALRVTRSEIDTINSQLNWVDLGASTRLENSFRSGEMQHTAQESARIAVLKEIRDRLNAIYDKLGSLPRCGQGFYPVFYRGGMIGIYLIKTDGESKIYERFIRTDEIANFFKEVHDPVGVGVHFSYGFTPWNNSVVVAPFVAIEAPNISVYHTFPGGSYLGTTSNVSGTIGLKVGPALSQDVWVYGLAGVSALNQTMKINFIPAFSSSGTTVAGATVGAGFAWHPASWQLANHPVSLFAEYQHTWWDDAHFNAPSASPAFNYTFRRQDDLVKLGLNISLGDFDAPPPASAFPVKAKPMK
jgi:opacity protein-like surface antigen